MKLLNHCLRPTGHVPSANLVITDLSLDLGPAQQVTRSIYMRIAQIIGLSLGLPLAQRSRSRIHAPHFGRVAVTER